MVAYACTSHQGTMYRDGMHIHSYVSIVECEERYGGRKLNVYQTNTNKCSPRCWRHLKLYQVVYFILVPRIYTYVYLYSVSEQSTCIMELCGQRETVTVHFILINVFVECELTSKTYHLVLHLQYTDMYSKITNTQTWLVYT